MVRHIHGFLLATVGGVLLAACATVTLAPGADKVKVTQLAADVAGCTAVGNIQVPKLPNGDDNLDFSGSEFRNLIVGLGGNAGFVTQSVLGAPIEGVAYRCP
jgi:hypothetical protein